MKHTLLICLLVAALFSACSSDDEGGNGSNVISQSVAVNACEVSGVDAKLGLSSSASYLWTMEQAADSAYSLTDTTAASAQFAAAKAGQYVLKLVATDNGSTTICHITVNVSASATAPSPYIAKVFDFLPAPGQFINSLPKWTDGKTKADVIVGCEEYLVGKKNGSTISLGGFGGYITFGFDHTIVNAEGLRDFRVMGNAFYADANPKPGAAKGGSCEPGIVMVAYDKNKNGQPDDDEWYEIAGSEYYKSTTIKNYEITYDRPTTETPDQAGAGNPSSYITINNYIHWTDNQGNGGYKVKNSYHNQSYYPGWITENQLTFKGTLLPNNAVEESGAGSYWVLYAYGYGYADNARNAEDDSAIDISWAVDANGKPVHLPGVDFVKVYCGINQEAGWLGETSTEVAGAYDLHLEGEHIVTK